MLNSGNKLLRLDHASLAVHSFSEALKVFDQQLGLSLTVSPGAPYQHGRLYLHRNYIEVSVQKDVDAWTVPLFFLGFDDLDALRAHLESIEFNFHWEPYVGVDGTWDNIELNVKDVPMPILVRRISPPEIAANWPPPLNKPHRCGAIELACIHLTVPKLGLAQDAYARLLGAEQNQIKLKEDDEIGVTGLIFKIQSIDETRNELGGIFSHPDDDGVSWVRIPEIAGSRIGFIT